MTQIKMLDPLDILLRNYLDQLSPSDMNQILLSGEQGERLKVNSSYIAIINAFKDANPDVDVAQLFRSKLKTFFNNESAALLGEITPAPMVSAPQRVQKLVEDIPSVSGTAFVDLIKFVSGNRPVAEVYNGSWIGTEEVQLIAELLWLKQEWIETGEGAISPLVVRKGVINPIIKLGGSYSNATCVKSELSIMKLPNSSFLVLQRGVVERNGGKSIFVNPIALYDETYQLDSILQSNSNVGALINNYEVSGDRWREYQLGELSLMGLYKNAKISSYVPE